jgi:fumarylacetoacetase
MHLPVQIPGYTDFYSSKEHATNVGCMFRDPKNALLPNWSELPVGYNGRASSVVVSGIEIVRPSGQIKLPEQERPVFSATRKLDFELETAFIVGKPSRLGQPIHIEDAEAHIFGMVLLNDWSARDIQQWEYVPLGPFNSKTFASAISPWVVTMQALQPFKVQGPVQEPRPLAYLQESVESSYDIQLSVEIQTPQNDSADVICQTNFKYMYWSMAQQLTHHTIAGCNVNVGDLMGSGTISGTTKDSYGSLLELTWNSTAPLTLSNGEQRSFVQDGDTVIMKGHAEKDGMRVGFGEVRNTILPALSFDFAEAAQVQHETV